jgi:hypothetical protein
MILKCYTERIKQEETIAIEKVRVTWLALVQTPTCHSRQGEAKWLHLIENTRHKHSTKATHVRAAQTASCSRIDQTFPVAWRIQTRLEKTTVRT